MQDNNTVCVAFNELILFLKLFQIQRRRVSQPIIPIGGCKDRMTLRPTAKDIASSKLVQATQKIQLGMFWNRDAKMPVSSSSIFIRHAIGSTSFQVRELNA